ISEKDLMHLNGYWEIQEVILADGTTKTYDISTTVDYIELDVKTLKGFRKKVQPNLTGTYQTSDHAEFFELINKDNSWVLVYKTAFETWEETLYKLDETSFSVKNADQITYVYKRFEAFELE
ncbi:hypothetical protein RZS08_30635, partial [Arthrospira platensis SPKY1]|nr:hypothetical protein [Arthrospira platensis SPKY1]